VLVVAVVVVTAQEVTDLVEAEEERCDLGVVIQAVIQAVAIQVTQVAMQVAMHLVLRIIGQEAEVAAVVVVALTVPVLPP
jgi:hypothetical protein